MQKKDVFVSSIKGFITGILSSYKHITFATLILAFNSYNNLVDGINSPKKYKKEFTYTVIPLILGIIIGLISGTKIISFITKKYKNQLVLLLIGITIGGIKTILKKEKIKLDKKNTIISTICLIIGMIVLYFTRHIDTSLNNKAIASIIYGILLGGSLFIPGLSSITTKINFNSIHHQIVFIIISVLLMLITIALVAKIIKIKISKNKSNTYILLCTLMSLNLMELIYEIDKIKIEFVNIFTLLLAFLWGYIFAKNVEKE